MHFKLVAPYKPSGDQPEAIQQLTGRLKQWRTLSNIVRV
jgi:excinuclease UvrABC helicase subunit UvrB